MIIAIVGEAKTGKSSFCLTGPKKLFYAELDMGGFARAARRHLRELGLTVDSLGSSVINNSSIHKVSYPYPQQILRDRLLKESGGKIHQALRLVGVKELWYKLLQDVIDVLENPEYKTIVIDSFPQLRELCAKAYLQERQEQQFLPNGQLKPGEVLRAQLQQIEYSEPNARTRAFLYAFREANKNLILPIYMTDKYEKKLAGDKIEDVITGRTYAGWSEDNIHKEADLVLTSYIEQVNTNRANPPVMVPKPVARIVVSGLGLRLVGMPILEPTWEKLDELIKMVNAE